MSNTAASASRGTGDARPLAQPRRTILHDYRAALDHGEGFAQTFDPRPDRGSRAEVEDHHMVLRVVDDLPKRELQLDAPPLVQAALEDRKLQPLPISIHQTENTAPTARVADVVA